MVGHSPPPFFKRGPAPLAKLVFFVTVSLALLVSDLNLRYLDAFRQGLSVLAYPLQMAAATPADFVRNASNYFASLVRLQIENKQVQLQGQAQLDALGMSTRLSTLRPMGSYRLVLQGGRHGEAPTLQLSTLDGALLLSGSGQWVGQRLRFTGEARAAPEREAALANLLNIIGRRSGARSIITLG